MAAGTGGKRRAGGRGKTARASASRPRFQVVSRVKIETAMARGAMDAVRRRDPKNIYHVMSLAQIKALTPSFNFDEYLKQVGLLQTVPPARQIGSWNWSGSAPPCYGLT